jgi:hypothetical protein
MSGPKPQWGWGPDDEPGFRRLVRHEELEKFREEYEQELAALPEEDDDDEKRQQGLAKLKAVLIGALRKGTSEELWKLGESWAMVKASNETWVILMKATPEELAWIRALIESGRHTGSNVVN